MIYRADVMLKSNYMSSWEVHLKVVQILMEMQKIWKGHVVYEPFMVELRKSDTLSTYWKTSWGAKRTIAVCADYVTVRTTRITQVDYMLFPNYIQYSLARSIMEEFEEREVVLA